MADVVQFRLERMVNELDDLERRGLFSRVEIADIVKKRRDFEFRLKRPSPLKPDFVAYIDYETQLDKLRDLRKHKIIGELKRKREEEEEESGEDDKKRKRRRKKRKGEKLWKRSVSDVAGVMRILDLYKKATGRYKGDLELWFRYLEFCRQGRHGRMKQALVEAIRFHPKVPGLWMYAAAWEFDQNLNVAAARALMQNGLRVCPDSEDMWIEYLRMELTYLNKLRARKVALGEDVETLKGNGGNREEMEKWKEENKDLFMSLNEDRKDSEGLAVPKDALEKKENFFWEQGSNILQTIYYGATDTLPRSMSLRKRFLEILEEIDIAQSNELKKEVMEDLRRHFSNDEVYWDWLARYEAQCAETETDLTTDDKLNKAIQVYDEALDILPSTKMFSLYSKFLLENVVPDLSDAISSEHEKAVDPALSSCLLNFYARAESNGFLSEELAQQYISFYLHMGRMLEARDLARRLCEGIFSQAAKLWILRVSVELKWLSHESTSMSDCDANYVFELLRIALAKSTISETELLWLMALKIFSGEKDHFRKLVDDFIIWMVKAGGDDCCYSVSAAILNRIVQNDGIKLARESYKRFLALPRPSPRLFKYCIELEVNLSLVGDNSGLTNARKLYESALSIYGCNRELWKNLYDLEIQLGTSETANAVYWRARKTLGDTNGLLASSHL